MTLPEIEQEILESAFLSNLSSLVGKRRVLREFFPEETIGKLNDPARQLKDILGRHEKAPAVKIYLKPDELLRFIKDTDQFPIGTGLKIGKDTSLAGVDRSHPLIRLEVKGRLDKSLFIMVKRKVAEFSLAFETRSGKLVQTKEDRLNINFVSWVGKDDQEYILKMLGEDSTGLDTEIKKRVNDLLKENGINRFLSGIKIDDQGMLVFYFGLPS